MSGGVAVRLERTLVASAAAAGVALSVEGARATEWASATFVGARHHLRLALSGGAAAVADWLDALPETELPMPGHLVADLIVTARGDGTAAIEVLTVVEAR